MDKLARNLPSGGAIELEIKFSHFTKNKPPGPVCSLSIAAAATTVQKHRTCQRSRSMHRASSRATSHDARNEATCDDDDAYSIDLRTQMIFPAAKILERKQKSSKGKCGESSRQEYLLRQAEKKSGAKKIAVSRKRLSMKDMTLYPGTVDVVAEEYDSASDINTDKVFPPAKLLSTPALSKKKSTCSSDSSR